MTLQPWILLYFPPGIKIIKVLQNQMFLREQTQQEGTGSLQSDTKHLSYGLTGVSGKSTHSVFSGERKQDTASSGKTSSSSTSGSSATTTDTQALSSRVQCEGAKLNKFSHLLLFWSLENHWYQRSFCFCFLSK